VRKGRVQPSAAKYTLMVTSQRSGEDGIGPESKGEERRGKGTGPGREYLPGFSLIGPPYVLDCICNGMDSRGAERMAGDRNGQEWLVPGSGTYIGRLLRKG
jgi:hypothetical protein